MESSIGSYESQSLAKPCFPFAGVVLATVLFLTGEAGVIAGVPTTIVTSASMATGTRTDSIFAVTTGVTAASALFLFPCFFVCERKNSRWMIYQPYSVSLLLGESESTNFSTEQPTVPLSLS